MPAPETNQPDSRPERLTCEQYVRGQANRCQHFLVNGACSLPSEFMCREWLKINNHRPLPPAKDLFGNPLPDPPAKKQVKPRPVVPAIKPPLPAVHQPTVPRWGLTTQNIESFRALKAEVCLWSQANGDLWLVPAYTGQPRKEITSDHLATIAQVLDAFPGSRVVAFEKLPPVCPPTSEREAP